MSFQQVPSAQPHLSPQAVAAVVPVTALLLGFTKFTAGLDQSPETQRTCWMTDGYSTCRELRQKNLPLLCRQTGPLQSSTLQQVTAGAATEPNRGNQSMGFTS